MRRCNLRARLRAGAELEDGDVSQLLPCTSECQAVDVSTGGYKCKAGVFITVVGISFNGLHTTAKWYLSAVQIVGVSASVWWVAGSCHR